ncbi:MAG: hypothetical protein MI746_18330 [Pseudomonadales bacterium]|nr:hypothetical protein [Pseudomonadales bacterium]
MNKLDETVLVAKICEQLDRSVDQLDQSILSKLDGARAHALSAKPETTQLGSLEDELLVDSVLSTLEEQTELPASIEQRLNRMRNEALSRMSDKHSKQSPLSSVTNWLQDIFGDNLSLSASMVATACLVVTVATLFYSPTDQIEDFSLDDELALVASADDLELYENLDFYLWLEENGFPDN